MNTLRATVRLPGASRDHPPAAVADILREAARLIEAGHTQRVLHDHRGREVGSVVWHDDNRRPGANRGRR